MLDGDHDIGCKQDIAAEFEIRNKYREFAILKYKFLNFCDAYHSHFVSCCKRAMLGQTGRVIMKPGVMEL